MWFGDGQLRAEMGAMKQSQAVWKPAWRALGDRPNGSKLAMNMSTLDTANKWSSLVTTTLEHYAVKTWSVPATAHLEMGLTLVGK